MVEAYLLQGDHVLNILGGPRHLGAKGAFPFRDG